MNERRPAGGIAVLSKLAIEDEAVIASPVDTWFPGQRIVLTTPFGKLQILNVHLRPAIDHGSWVRGYLTTPPLRLREITAYWATLAHDLPTLVAGDFNEDLKGSAVGFLADQGLALVSTKGPPTWHYTTKVGKRAVDALAIDIDHIMIDKSLSARDGKVLDAGTSDHRPVVVTIAKTDAKN